MRLFFCKEKDAKIIISQYNAVEQWLYDNKINCRCLSNSTEILFFKKSDAVKTLKYIYKNYRKLFYFFAHYDKTHKIENKIFYEYTDYYYSDEIKFYYIYR